MCSQEPEACSPPFLDALLSFLGELLSTVEIPSNPHIEFVVLVMELVTGMLDLCRSRVDPEEHEFRSFHISPLLPVLDWGTLSCLWRGKGGPPIMGLNQSHPLQVVVGAAGVRVRTAVGSILAAYQAASLPCRTLATTSSPMPHSAGFHGGHLPESLPADASLCTFCGCMDPAGRLLGRLL